MLYHKILRVRMNGGAASADVAWYDDDPDADPAAAPFLYDAVPLDAANIGAVTAEILDDALARREDQLAADRAGTTTPRPEVAAMLGQGRVRRGGRYERVNKRGGRS